MKPQPYMQAKAFPPLKSPPGLDVPKPASDMTIPSVPDGPVGHYAQAPANADPDNPAARCLSTPPPMGAG